MSNREARPPPASRADAAAHRTRRSEAAPVPAGRPRRRRSIGAGQSRTVVHEANVTLRRCASSAWTTEPTASNVDLPDERITVIEPMPRPAVPDVAGDAGARDPRADRLRAAAPAGSPGPTGGDLRLRHHAGPAAARTAAGALRRDAGHPAIGHHHLHRDRHAPLEHRRRARADARARHPLHLPRRQSRQPRSRRRSRPSAERPPASRCS